MQFICVVFQFLPIELFSKLRSELASSTISSWSSSKSSCSAQVFDITRHRTHSKQVKRPTVERRKTFLFFGKTFWRVFKSKARNVTGGKRVWQMKSLAWVRHTFIAFVDINESVKAQQQLRQSNSRYQDIISFSLAEVLGKLEKFLSHQNSFLIWHLWWIDIHAFIFLIHVRYCKTEAR